MTSQPPRNADRTLIHERVDAARRGQNPTVICRMSSGWAVLGDNQFLTGYSLLLPDPVVDHLTDLDHDHRAHYLTDMAPVWAYPGETRTGTPFDPETHGDLQRQLAAHLTGDWP